MGDRSRNGNHIMQRILLVIVTISILSGLAACAAPAATPTAPALTGDSLRIEGAWARPSVVPNGNSAIYLTIVNPTDQADRLLSVRSPSGMAETHESITENGVVRMEPRPEGYVVAPRSIVVLLPGSKHIMLIGVAEPLAPGDEITATLLFERAGEITLNVPVEDQP